MAPSPSSSLGGRTIFPTSSSFSSARRESLINWPCILIDSGAYKQFNSGFWCRPVLVLTRLNFLNLMSHPGILVRDEAARDNLRAIVGDIGLIMSVTLHRISYHILSKYEGHSAKPKGSSFQTSCSTISSAIPQPYKRIGASSSMK
jgi:hypothetical protein